MLGDSTSVLGSSTSRDAAAVAVAAPESGGGDGSNNNSGEETFRGGHEELSGGGERSFGGNRWPRQETLALLQIRSDMDVAFRDASVKGPLWEEVSRKLAALGYHRSAKKCKEKFENVYKYHRRTKEGRTGKSEGKTYRFFDQLNAFENQPPTPGSTSTSHHHQQKPHQPMAAAAATMTTTAMANPPPTIFHLNSSTTTTSTTVPSSAAPHPTINNVYSQGIATPTLNKLTLPSSFPPTNPIVLPPPPQPPPHQPTTANPTTNANQHQQQQHTGFPTSFTAIPTDIISNSTSSSTSSDEELEGRAKKKRKWKEFFERLMKDVIQKQEDLQKRFLETIEKREQERMVREEAWRMQEMARINREREILAQERSITAAKDAAVMSFLQRVSEQQQNQNQNQHQSMPNQSQLLLLQPAPLPPPPRKPAPPPPQAQPQQTAMNIDIVSKSNNNGENDNLMMLPSSSRWPKVEVQALIKLRTSLDSKYQENGPKGPLWEEISGAMRKLGYNRNAKRCKEKWENINKYFKKVKESNKKRPEDSKTCPYFHQLDSLYRERNKFDQNNVNSTSTINSSSQFKPENSVPLMVRPEQQWPPQPPPPQQQDHQGLMMGIDHHQNQGDDHHDQQDKENNIGDDDDEEEDGEEEEDYDEGDGNYEIVANKPAPVGAATAE
ncbi:hypothetical protein COP2_002583 [Malus domestica]